jgi:hypothetical protein
MKALTRHISMTIVAIAAIAGGAAAATAGVSSCADPPGPYPTFCSIPKPPTMLKSPATIHREVLQTRLIGRDLVQATRPSTFTLDDTAGFAQRATTEAAPPPPVTTPSEADTDAFAKTARDTATPPKHPR